MRRRSVDQYGRTLTALPGLESFDAEWANIRRGQEWAAANIEDNETALRLANAYLQAGIACLELRLPPRQRIHWLETALTAARALNDRSAEANHLGNLGVAYSDLAEPRRAMDHYEQALYIARETNDRPVEGSTLNNLGTVYTGLLSNPQHA